MINPNGWQLIEAIEREWQQDTSGIYTVINWTASNKVRMDVMNTVHMPIISIEAESSGGVYKAFADWLKAMDIVLSMEHAMYIGRELGRCEEHRENYSQE